MPADQTFHWTETRERVASLAAHGPFAVDEDGLGMQGAGARFTPPRLVPVPEFMRNVAPGPDESVRDRAARLARDRALTDELDPLERYARALPEELPSHCLILLQAGAATLGYFQAGVPIATKTLKRYVVRGKGRAQPTYLKEKGKSRYGSRLRLQNAQRLMHETIEKLHEYWGEYGTPEHVFANAPARLWADLFRGKTSPPFTASDPIVRIPLDLKQPTTDVMLRAYKALGYGRISFDADE